MAVGYAVTFEVRVTMTSIFVLSGQKQTLFAVIGQRRGVPVFFKPLLMYCATVTSSSLDKYFPFQSFSIFDRYPEIFICIYLKI